MDCIKQEGSSTERAKANSSASASSPPTVTAINSEYSSGTKMSSVHASTAENSRWLTALFVVNARKNSASEANNDGQKNRKEAPAKANTVTRENSIFHTAPAARYSVKAASVLSFLRQKNTSPPKTMAKVRAKGTPEAVARR